MKGLEAIISLRNRLVEKGIKDQFLEELIPIEKELRGLEILKESIDLSYDKYRNYITLKNHEVSLVLTKEKCDLLKEVLKNESNND